jgi:hypothetical protein
MTDSNFSKAFDRMTRRIEADPEIRAHQTCLSFFIIVLANLAGTLLVLGYIWGGGWDVPFLVWVALAYGAATQVFWTWALGKKFIALHDLLDPKDQPGR